MSKQLFGILLDGLKRSNKDRKLKLAIKAGFKTIEDYKNYLENQISGKSSEPVEEESTENITDMVIAFDTTGSMNGYINAVKKHVKELIPKLFKENPGLQLSIVAFGDYCDIQKNAKDGYGVAYQVIELTNNENKLIDFVTNAKGTGGGDGDEFYELVIKKITEETTWRDGSGKSVLLIGDAVPHKPGYRYDNITYQIDWRTEAQEAAKKGIIFDTLTIHGNAWYRELSQITGGVNLPFSNKDTAKTGDLLEATSLARGGAATRNAFMAKSVSSSVTSDVTMDAVYQTYSKDLTK